MGISKEVIRRIYALAKNPEVVRQMFPEDIAYLMAVASELAEYYEAEEERRWEKEMRAERRR